MRQIASSGSPLEPEIGLFRSVRIGFSRAVRAGDTVGSGDVGAQTRRCLDVSVEALEAVGARLEDVVRTRIVLTDIAGWRGASAAHGEYFSEIRPAATFVEVPGFIDPRRLVETEIDAIIADDQMNAPAEPRAGRQT